MSVNYSSNRNGRTLHNQYSTLHSFVNEIAISRQAQQRAVYFKF